MPRQLKLAAARQIPQIASEESLVAFNYGPDKAVYLVRALRGLDYHDVHSGASFPRTVPQKPQKYRVVVLQGDQTILNVVTGDEPFNIHDVQPLGDEILLVCCRSHYRGPKDYEKNGRVFDSDGNFVREVLLGDGIQSVQTTSNGTIWTSYFDEGVFGNFGWSDPVGASGLVAWSASGEKLYEFQPPAGFGEVCDCYAINVESENVVWCYYYTEFPLVKLRGRKVEAVWNMPLKGSDGFAIFRDHALFRGGYGQHDTYKLYHLGHNEKVEWVSDLELIGDDGVKIIAERVVGRGETMLLISKGLLYQVNVQALIGG